MDFEQKQRDSLEKILQKGRDECKRCNLLDDMSRTEYLRSIAGALTNYYGLESSTDFFKTPYDLICALVNIFRNKDSSFNLDGDKIHQLKKNAVDEESAWQYLAAGTVSVFQKRQMLSKFVSVRELAKFLSAPR